MNIWDACNGIEYITPLTFEPWRVVEAQHISSSRDLVESREEHDVLEMLLETAKPWVDKNTHYLVFSPFRYPPLKYGSRFGQPHEPSLWYGSLTLDTAFAEVAYYRLQFFQDTAADLGYIEIPMTAFQVHIRTEHGIDLTNQPFSAYVDHISNQTSYEYSQPLGRAMREASVGAFAFFSARTRHPGTNIAAFTPRVFHKTNDQYIFTQQNWRCIANKSHIEFTRSDLLKKEGFSYSLKLKPTNIDVFCKSC